MKYITPESMRQYQREERALMATRVKTAHKEIEDVLRAMEHDRISLPKHVEQLRENLAIHYQNREFLECKNMGEILRKSLEQLL